MRFIVSVIVLGVLTSCGTLPKQTTANQKEVLPTIFEEQYYQDLKRNIVRLHHLMQGTFTAYAQTQDAKLKSWNVSEGDSVVLCTVPLGDVDRHGYWIYSYEFMTSLPDKPIYTAIKEIKQVSRDTFDVLYYTTKSAIDLTLKDVLDQKKLNSKIQIDSLVLKEKKVRYIKKSTANFVGHSAQYEDRELRCLRQNIYDVSPNFYKVETTFYDKQTNQELSVKKRPNLLIRRGIGEKVLTKIANKE